MPRHDTMVDSTPTLAGPPSMIRSMRPSRSAQHMLRRRSARHGRTDWPTARPPACRTPSADRARPVWSGTRTAIESSPAVASSDTGQPSAFGSTSVSGPGQNTPASSLASSEKRASASAALRVRHMRDQRIEARAALGRIEPRDRFAVGGVGAEAVDRLGRKRDQPAVRRARARPPRSRRGSRRANVSPLRRALAAFRSASVRLHWAGTITRQETKQ